MKIIIEVKGGLVTNVITTGKSEICILDYDNIEQADSLQGIKDCFFIYDNDSVIKENDFKKQRSQLQRNAVKEFKKRKES